MGLYAPSDYWLTDLDRYINSEALAEDIPGLPKVLLDSFSMFGLTYRRRTAVQHLRRRLDAEHKTHRRSVKELLKNTLVITRKDLAKDNIADFKDVGGNVGRTDKRASKQSLHGSCRDPGILLPEEAAELRTLRRTRDSGSTDTDAGRRREIWESMFPAPSMDEFDSPKIADLPFYDFGDSSRSIFDEVEPIKSGAWSQVYEVRIHLDRMHGRGGEESGKVAFAVKELNSGNDQQFAREVDALRQLSLARHPHPHIVPLLASYRAESRDHLVFPLADCDLATFWRNQPRPSNDKRTLEWFGGQMRGLADALYTIHGQKGQEKILRGIHGDFKPENILCFDSNDSERRSVSWPVFALTDFGSSYFLTPEEKDFPKGLKHTPVYRAPELDTSTDGITQAYDIWSLGCVFAEAIAWFYEGKAGIAKLIRARLDGEDNNPNRDAFFWLKHDSRWGLTAKLKPEVQRLLISLRENSQSSLFIDDLLYLVLEGMLKVNISERMSAREILDALTQMCVKLENDPAYSEPRGSCDVEMVPNQNAGRQRLDQTVDANYYTDYTTQSEAVTQDTNLTTQSDAGTQESPKPLFACPFYAVGVQISGRRVCEGRGFPDATKTKEHVIRHHLPKEYRGKHICPRCYTGFNTDELLQAHAHQEPPCSAKTPEAVTNKLSGEHAFQLRSMKRKSLKESAEDRWFDICRIIFPTLNRNLENISPYRETNSTNSSTGSNGISQYRDYLRNRGAEEHAAELAKRGINVTLEVAAKLLESQVKDVETFDETMRGPFHAYGFEADNRHE
ncbi:serine threonine kinase [Fusarium mundagurra]|uniref:Serine threonine kinase n=1 Tax=Fusarium mundagurra TaxID=1567541 RepID=A0A8H6DF43_9HYPO|nr:serine threonine kinase [Fusarium mundagurra]